MIRVSVSAITTEVTCQLNTNEVRFAGSGSLVIPIVHVCILPLAPGPMELESHDSEHTTGNSKGLEEEGRVR